MKLIFGSLFPKLNNFQIFGKKLCIRIFCILFDRRGPIGRSAQVLFIAQWITPGRVNGLETAMPPGEARRHLL
ncbi:hypothetical protein ACFSQQ_16090 [Mesorhizobium kowhaii]|uniref:hypothetical protein n=1 Tax=Mesorhizobium kowhaii TaxID=1300272 RepID=UPI00363EA2FB